MHRIDTPSAQIDKFGAGKNGFTRDNPQTGEPATALDDDYFDAIQEEIAGVVESTGVALDKSNRTQLMTALKKLFLRTSNNFSEIAAAGTAAQTSAIDNIGGISATNARIQLPGTLSAAGTITSNSNLIVAGRGDIAGDLRGAVVYSTADGYSQEVNDIGELPSTFTLLAPKTPYDKWNGAKWVTDKVAQQASETQAAEEKKARLSNEATVIIAPLQDAVDTELATNDEKARLTAWKTYRVLLSRIDTSKAPDIEWPVAPE
ncbi:tail fiber assembly protein [Yersinia pekkanenii]|uniref:tail fiber assembly protein n=1 Tax=Yersinia pekkanenii TaxID=1288385 RepID=UPI000680C4D0|nr:tail fiber assembly protein [Yersinia pekkanenii]